MIVQEPYHYLGVLLIALGIALTFWAYQLFQKKKTSLIIEGPFGFSRNPMSLGLVVVLLGIAVLINKTAGLLLPMAMILALEAFLIPAEEKTLKKTFGQKYSAYQKRVRRWF